MLNMITMLNYNQDILNTTSGTTNIIPLHCVCVRACACMCE